MISRENKMKSVEADSLKKELPNFRVGDTVKVHVKIAEDEKTRTQIFEGIVIAKRGTGVSSSFTVRKISFGEGIERAFPLHSPFVQKVEVVKKGKVRRSKLYYLRKKIGKATRVDEKIGAASKLPEPKDVLLREEDQKEGI